MQPSLSLSVEGEGYECGDRDDGLFIIGRDADSRIRFYHMVLPRLPMILGMNPGDSGMIFLIQASWYFIYAVFVLFIVNLFPMISSDIFLIIVAISPKRLIPLMKNDTLIKGLLIVCIVLGGISALAVQGMNGMEQFLGFV